MTCCGQHGDIIVRQLYVLPPGYNNLTMQEALEWCTDEVLRLDEENQRLRKRLDKYEGIHTLQGPQTSTRG